MADWSRVALALATLAYPFIVYFSVEQFEPRMLAVVLVVLALSRALLAHQGAWAVAAGAAVLLGAAAWLGNAWLPLKLYPVLVNATLLLLFLASLLHPPTAIERLARLADPDLSPAGVAYTRTVTWVWAGFFVVNGTIALATALWASDAVWALYNGLIAYVLVGLLFAGEWLVRRRVRAAHG